MGRFLQPVGVTERSGVPSAVEMPVRVWVLLEVSTSSVTFDTTAVAVPLSKPPLGPFTSKLNTVSSPGVMALSGQVKLAGAGPAVQPVGGAIRVISGGNVTVTCP